MKIFIPRNLSNIEIISQLSKMIDGYEKYYEETEGSFDNYYYYLNYEINSCFLYILKHE